MFVIIVILKLNSYQFKEKKTGQIIRMHVISKRGVHCKDKLYVSFHFDLLKHIFRNRETGKNVLVKILVFS